MDYKLMKLEEIVKSHFPHHDVLTIPEDRAEREHALKSATALTMSDHEEIGLIIHLENGEQVKVVSNMVELEADFVELNGGYMIPVKAILRVEL